MNNYGQRTEHLTNKKHFNWLNKEQCFNEKILFFVYSIFSLNHSIFHESQQSKFLLQLLVSIKICVIFVSFPKSIKTWNLNFLLLSKLPKRWLKGNMMNDWVNKVNKAYLWDSAEDTSKAWIKVCLVH